MGHERPVLPAARSRGVQSRHPKRGGALLRHRTFRAGDTRRGDCRGHPRISTSLTSQSLESNMTEDYDVVVIGSGIGGKVLSWTLASQGKRVAVVERKYVGGSCPNIACLPSKNVVHSAKLATYLREFGGRIDMTTVRNRKRKMVDGLVAAHLQKFQESGAELIMGSGRFV